MNILKWVRDWWNKPAREAEELIQLAQEVAAMEARLESGNAAHQVENLVALVTRLSRALRKAAPSHELPDAAMDYLKREGLAGSPLRDSADDQVCLFNTGNGVA